MHKVKKILSACMALVVLLSLFSTTALAEGSGNENGTPATAVSDKKVDGDTHQSYTDILGDNTTRYDGRIWTDKTVTTTGLTFKDAIKANTSEAEDYTVPVDDSELLVTYSALATSTVVEQTTPVDVVFVLDFSASMNWATDDQQVTATNKEDAKEASRLNGMVNALNKAVNTLIQHNEKNRIGVVVFNGTASELMKLTTAGDIADKNLDGQYFTISKFELKAPGEKQEADATVKCKINGKEADTAGGTNIQAGLNLGVNMLEQATETKVQLDDGTEVTRVPNLILMSDGAPTTFASAENTKYKIKVQDKDAPNDYRVEEKIGCLTHNTNDIFADKAEERKAESGSWWESGTLSHEAIGPGNNNKPDSADGFMALLTVAYGKEKITEHYYPDPDEDGSANIYTVGFSTNQQTDAMVEMANLVLNPGVNLEKAKGSSVAAVKEVYEAWEKYSKGEKTVVHAPLGGSSDIFEYTVDRPGDGLPKSLNYTDGYYPATSSDELWNAFYQIVNTITSNAKMPTLVTGSATESGYLT